MTQPSLHLFGWRTAVLCALSWGVAVTFACTVVQPISGLPLANLAVFVIQLMIQWCLTGLVWTFGARLIRERWKTLVIGMLFAATFIVAFASQWAFARATVTGDAMAPVVGAVPTTDLALYIAWDDLFYGGLYIVGYLFFRRTAVLRRRLAAYRLARNEADTAMREARVSAYRGQLQPEMLLSALAALRERYASDSVSAGVLFDQLIAFLRASMPATRSGLSTLPAEIETARSYAALRQALAISGPRWRLDCDALVPALPFPALILLPALDAITALIPDDGVIALEVRADADTVSLRIAASHPATLPAPIHQRLVASLALTFGSSALPDARRELPIDLRLPILVDPRDPDTVITGGRYEAIVPSPHRGGAAREPVMRG